MTLYSAPEIRAHVARTARSIAPVWPLGSFIAVNPLAGSVAVPFAELPHGAPTRAEAAYLREYETGSIPPSALRTAIGMLLPEVAAIGALTAGDRTATGIDIAICALLHAPADDPDRGSREHEQARDVDDYLSHLLSRLYGDPYWAPPRADGLFARFLAVAEGDRLLPRSARRVLRALPRDAGDAIATVLHRNGWDGRGVDDLDRLLDAQLDGLPGWAAHLAWRATRTGDATLTDYLAMRLSLLDALGHDLSAPPPPESAGWRPDASWVADVSDHCFGTQAGRALSFHVVAALDPATRRLLWQTAAECAYRSDLLRRLETAAPSTAEPESQLLFCIDVRSEGMRRQLEQDPGISTLGMAGFFGIPLLHTGLNSTVTSEQFPALLSSGIPSGEVAVDREEARHQGGRLSDRAARASAGRTVASTPIASFSWAEISGWAAPVAAIVRSLTARTGRDGAAAVATTVDICERLDLEERIALAETACRMTGLTAFAPLVVFVGHRSTTTNNLYRAALDCGACGGNPGGVNARAAAAVFNDPEVRAGLAERGIRIPESTWFAAAEHDTTTDRLTLLDPHLVPASHRERVSALEREAERAADRLTRERTAALPGARRGSRPSSVRARANDWAEMFPELGLAGNAALLIGPRSISRGADLQRRVFLHDYDPAADPDGSGLENIMTAPLIVAQWINAQYYFSTVLPDRYGAGSKTVHNPVGDIGVLAGHLGDLRSGLPWQSVAAGSRLLHQPLRLSVLIQAPLDRIGRIVSAEDTLRRLLDGGWITLHARATTGDVWHRYTPYGFTPEEGQPA
ncbi:DUF2309 domain-containing protein [Leifsonia sp. AG29]|uniref:DUF2309 domain-containing protein n=1 Tax=Leifsonia sp. AG29 TaxID=2598860 RepID=UPI00131B0B90|nr:DUF2309 domain-containing protein [Leifsonia sp. AG29]